jgi:NTP pyrophosphatase (non-canonical NTP hydrolase)
MPDDITTIAVLKDRVRAFVAERAWERFHTPKNLVMGLAIEAAELMEPFLWLEGEASRQISSDPPVLSAVADEMADVACYLLSLALALNIDLSQAIISKIDKNAIKYPADQYRGRYRLESGGPQNES